MIEVTVEDLEAAIAYLEAGALVFEQDQGHAAATGRDVMDFLSTEDPLFFLYAPALAVMFELATTRAAEQFAGDVVHFLADEADR